MRLLAFPGVDISAMKDVQYTVNVHKQQAEL